MCRQWCRFESHQNGIETKLALKDVDEKTGFESHQNGIETKKWMVGLNVRVAFESHQNGIETLLSEMTQYTAGLV